ncbi:MAG: PHB depolymerase family esterase [Mycobacterium sp.]|nr:PHB depolymerase family esterase [Mycobacterium sp.]
MFRPSALLAAVFCLVVLPAAPASAVVDAPGALMTNGGQRTYVLHIPPGDHPNGLVINLHGAGMTGQGQAAATNYNAVADQFGLAVVYPDGIDMSWADGRGASTPDRTGVDDVGFLVALADRITHDYGIPPGRVFATGMSAGAFMAERLACQRADVVSAIAAVAGTLGSAVPCGPSRPVSVLQVHGTADAVVPFNGGPMVGRGGPSDIVAAPVMADRWRAMNGCPGALDAGALSAAGDGTGVRLLTAAGCGAGTEVQLVEVDGGGHTWPGGVASPAAGPTTRAYDASYASAQFFAGHGR